MSRRWPGWETLPGIEIAPLAGKAREQGQPVRRFSYAWNDPDGGYVTTAGWMVSEDGQVTLASGGADGWEPVVTDGMLTGFRNVRSDRREYLVKPTMVVLPEGNYNSPALLWRCPEEHVGRFIQADVPNALETVSEDPPATISVAVASEDGGIVMQTWGLTWECGKSLAALLRSRYGEPMMEALVDASEAKGYQDVVLDALDEHAIFTCAHEGES